LISGKSSPPDLQKIFSDAAIEVQNWTRKYAYEADISYRKLLQEKGLVAITIDQAEFKRWRDKVAPVLEETYKKAVGQEKGQKMLDIIKKTCF
jgi:TRAP-type C4-dicarboxylate transport system substrate-binding protein